MQQHAEKTIGLEVSKAVRSIKIMKRQWSKNVVLSTGERQNQR